MPIAACPSCQTRFRIADGVAGKALKCARCGKIFRANSPPNEDIVYGEGDVEVVSDSDEEGGVYGVAQEEKLEEVDEPADDREEQLIVEEGDPFEGEDVSEGAQRRILGELEDGELIVWVGRPSLRLLPRRIGMGLPIGAIFLVLSLWGLVEMAWALLTRGPARVGPLIEFAGLGCLALFIAAFGAWVCVRSLALYWVRLIPSLRATYVLTNRRALLFGALWGIRRYYPSDVADLRVREVPPYDGGGHLIFEYVDAVQRVYRGIRFVQVPRGFLWVENVHKVKPLIRKVLRERRA